jgi:hypothetical protein
MTDTSKVWNQQVATVGTALVFTVPPYDYYKICTVQTINDTPTEVGGVYKTVDYGQTLFIDIIDKKSLAFAQSVLNNHQEAEALSVGDETIIVVGGHDWIMQVGRIDSANHIIDFVSKYIYAKTTLRTYYGSSEARTIAQSFYTAIAQKDKQYIKEMTREYGRSGTSWTRYTDYVWIPTSIEAANTEGSSWDPPTGMFTQLPIFTTQASRIRQYEGVNTAWWTTDEREASGNPTYYIDGSGALQSGAKSNNYGVLPCFRLTADS